MTVFEFTVPLLAFAVAAIGYLLLRAEERKLEDRSSERLSEERGKPGVVRRARHRS